ncbi:MULTISPECIES: hypothetical protein [Klebsiella pneumoniae complex]|nr:hypothetical protein [Klebsiella variicola]HBT4717389.1 hypothetical protein [Klebsiella quasipneumoniae subsp. quasipneumoniae]HBV2378264.1 hypothetical protein [Klebsiella quasipneumoniae]
MPEILLNKYFVAIGIPLILIACGSVVKKLVRGSAWERKDLYFGVELTLTSVGAALLNLYDLGGAIKNKAAGGSEALLIKLTGNTVYLCISLLILLWIVALHQDWENRTGNRNGQVSRLIVLSNLVGIVMFASFVLLVKGI